MTGHIFIYGEIGSQVTAESVQAQIDPQASDYEIHISSVGGDVYEGYGIYGILNGLGKPTRVVIEGLCASIATLIAQAGDKVVMTNPAEFMIHNPFVGLQGDADDLRQAAEQLDRIKDTIISVYRKKTGLSEAELSEMMTAETWMTANEAKQRGFVDEVHEKLKAVAYIDTTKIKMSKEKNKFSEIMERGFAEIKALLNPKNMATLTLENGAVIIVGTETETPTPDEMVGAMVTMEDGTPLEDGVYKLVEGVEITVSMGKIDAAVSAPAPQTQPEEEVDVDALKAKIAELEAALSAKDSAIENKEAEIKAANKTINKFKASVETLEAKYNEIKNITAGDNTPPIDVPKTDTEAVFDPMAEELNRFLEGRGLK